MTSFRELAQSSFLPHSCNLGKENMNFRISSIFWFSGFFFYFTTLISSFLISRIFSIILIRSNHMVPKKELMTSSLFNIEYIDKNLGYERLKDIKLLLNSVSQKIEQIELELRNKLINFIRTWVSPSIHAETVEFVNEIYNGRNIVKCLSQVY